jgi:hypothetical protein
MNANATHPLAKLTAAEAALIASIESAAAKLDAVGTSALDAALSRLRDAAHAAAARLGSAGDAVAHVVDEVLGGMLAQAGRIEDAIDHAEPAEPAVGYTFAEPAGQVEPEAPVASSSPDGRDDAAAPEPVNTLIPNEGIDAKGVRPPDTLDSVEGADEKGVCLSDTLRDEQPAFTPDGPTLFDDAGNHAFDPTEVLVGPNAVEYQVQRPGPNADESPVFPVTSPRRKKKGR